MTAHLPFGEITETMAWTGSGYIDMLEPDPAAIVLLEVATGLSRETRYGGAATSVSWPVSQHSLMAYRFARDDGVTDETDLRCIFMHDGPEYMIRDLIAPLKRGCPEYKGIESRWWRAFATRFDLPVEMPEIVKHYDNVCGVSEKVALVSPEAGRWPVFDNVEPRRLPPELLAMNEKERIQAFLDAAAELRFT